MPQYITTQNKWTMAALVITQEYYDEICFENVDVFGLNEEDAVSETEQQLKQSSSSSSSSVALDHLSRTFPTSLRGIQERNDIQEFTKTLSSLSLTESDKYRDDSNDLLLESLLQIQQTVETQRLLFLSVLNANNGFSILVQKSVSLWKKALSSSDSETYHKPIVSTLQTVEICLKQAFQGNHPRKRELIMAFQSAMTPALVDWIRVIFFLPNKENPMNLDLLQKVLDLLCRAIKQCESNKKVLMGSCVNDDNNNDNNNNDHHHIGAPRVLILFMDSLSVFSRLGNAEGKASVIALGRALCRLIISLCTFEPNNTLNYSHGAVGATAVTGGPPNVSSAHANVMTFHQEGMIQQLSKLLVEVYPPSLEPSVLLTLRAMAIHNEVVKTIQSVGLLQRARDIFVQLAEKEQDCAYAVSDEATTNETTQPEENHDSGDDDDDDDDNNKDDDNNNKDDESSLTAVGRVERLVAVVGLFRNMCANDEIKTALCLGKTESIMEALVYSMTVHLKHPLLQEHGCGTIAAMALRKPKNAQALVQTYQAHQVVIAAMRAHPQRATLQRQAALALRNLVSRSPDELRPALSQAGAEQALLQIVAQHGSCQDEAYAALRDMGVNVSIVHVRPSEDGQGGMVVKSTEMFGEVTNSNFRAVYD